MLLSSVWLQIQASDQNKQLSPLNQERSDYLEMMNVKNQNMVSAAYEYFDQFTCDENQKQEIEDIKSLCEQNVSMGQLIIELVKQDSVNLDTQWADFISKIVRNCDTIIHRTTMLAPFLEETKVSDKDRFHN